MSKPSALEGYIRQRLAGKNAVAEGVPPILLMSHIVLGYPSLEENAKVISQMVDNGVDLMELQIPFSEPVADGPEIAHANQLSLERGFRVEQGLAFIHEVTRRHPIPFLIMTYYNILFAHGVAAFIQRAAACGVHGLIVPDLPPEEAEEAMTLCREAGMDWIQLMTTTTPEERLHTIGARASGFCYCVARKGVTGKETAFSEELTSYLNRCQAATDVPLAVGFGVKEPADVAFLAGRAEIAVVGTAAIRIHLQEGAEAVGRFFARLQGVKG